MKKIIFLIIPCFLFFGCGSKKEYLVKTRYQEVKIPIKCNLKIPAKPKFKNDFESAKELSKYYLQVEKIAKICTGEDI